MSFVEEVKYLQKNSHKIQSEKLKYEQHLYEEIKKLNPMAIDIMYNRYKDALRAEVINNCYRPGFIYIIHSDLDFMKKIFIQKFIDDGLICIDNEDYGFDIQIP